MARYRALSTPSQTNQQSTHAPTAPRTRPTRRCHYTVIDDCYLSNDDHSPMESDHMVAANNQSLNHCSSSDYDNAFVTFKAPPPPERKKAAERVKCSNKLAKNKRKGKPLSPPGLVYPFLPFCHSAILSAIPPFPPFPPFDHSVCHSILPFRRCSAIPAIIFVAACEGVTSTV